MAKDIESAYWSGVWFGALAGAAVGGGGALFYAQGLQDYGSAMFLGVPVTQGLVAGYVTQWYGGRTWSACAGATMISCVMTSIAFLFLGAEGLLCLLMAAPLVIGLGLIGATVGWAAGQRRNDNGARMALVPLGALAVTFGGGPMVGAPEASGEVTTVWHLSAPPERVWPHVLNIPNMSEPDWWLFRAGVAHPIRTETLPDGRRTCFLSTGPMPEVVIAREENRRLTFRVLKTPAAMKELNPFREVHAPHLETVYRSKEGEFRLYPEGTGTRLVARSTYGLRMGPAWYWQLWSDAIVRHVHQRVVRSLDH